VGPDDGLLVIDADSSGTINESKEYVFTDWSDTAETDLEAVAEVFDSNQDGVLDAQDDQFDQFAVWQDANSDGITDEGELQTLSELGIDSIDLNYSDDSEPSTAADGDVTIHGQVEVNLTDGSSTIAEDVSFAISVEDVLGDDDMLNLPGDEESVAAAIDPESLGGAGVVSDYDAAMLEADLMSAQNPDDKPDLQSD
ncbi:hypothetical protein OAY01_05550, partial [Luminiphilus sp.]|nr:hypothetical protein [Luminiphilus sp.]